MLMGFFPVAISIIFFSLHQHGNSLNKRAQEVMLTHPGSFSHPFLFQDLLTSLVTSVCAFKMADFLGLLFWSGWVWIARCPSCVLTSRGSALNRGKECMRSQRSCCVTPGLEEGGVGPWCIRQFLWVKGVDPAINQERHGVCPRSEGKPGLTWTHWWSLGPSDSPPSVPTWHLLVPISLTAPHASHMFFCN